MTTSAPLSKAVDADRLRRTPPAPAGRRGPLGRRLVKRLVWGVALMLLAAMSIIYAPVAVPFADDYLTNKVTERIAVQMACPGSTTPPPQITLKGGRIPPQLVSRKLSEIQLSVPDTAVGGVQHATFAATLRGVTQPTPDTAHADSLDASITLGFADLPAPPDGPRPSFGRAEDGSLIVTVTPSAEQSQATKVKGTLFLKLDLQGETLIATPQWLQLFGHLVPAAKVSALTGGARSQKLPRLPGGLKYTSITPEKDGLHVALDGAVTTPLSDLPTSVGQQTVSYVAEKGRLGISTVFNAPLIGEVPLTIFTAPRLRGSTLALVPQSVRILGADRGPDDAIAKAVLTNIKQADLTRRLPALPSGVKYRSVSVDRAGIKMAVGGVVVKPFSEMPPDSDGRKPVFSAQNGLLTATSEGMSPQGSPMPLTLFASPKIADNALVLAPQTIQMFDTLFPAADVLSEIKTHPTTFPLQVLPDNLSYTGVEVLTDGLRVTVSGTDVALSKGLMGGMGCTTG